jgi:hypothetical protein
LVFSQTCQDDQERVGNMWTFCALDANTKLVLSFMAGKRDTATADAFIHDVARHLRRHTRLTNAFSKKLQNRIAATALHFAHCNFARRHQTLRVSPAMASGVSATLWSTDDLLNATIGAARWRSAWASAGAEEAGERVAFVGSILGE